MINTVADFLEQLKSKGENLIKKYEVVKHPVLIGDMYEGLTQEILRSTIFAGLNLKIVGGKIKNSKGFLSGEIDCMIVEGEGDEIPFTDKFIYHFTQVVAVLQVKKSLYSEQIDDSFYNLKSVIDVSIDPEKDGENIIYSLRDAYKSIVLSELPKRSELQNLPEREQYIYHTLLMEAYFPLRIVFGYYGYKSEFKLRQGFAKFLDKSSNSKKAKRFGLNSLPNLIICGTNSIIKINGMPFSIPISNDEFYWPLYTTAPKKPIYYLLCLIWTRLSYRFKISGNFFGDDFEDESLRKYINCKIEKYENNYRISLKYFPFSEKILNDSAPINKPWSPIFLNESQFNIIFKLTLLEVIDIRTDPDIKREKDIKLFIENLIETKLVYKKNHELRLLPDKCGAMILPDGRYCAGSNKNGEFFAWIKKETLLNK